MVFDPTRLFSASASALRASEIRELLKLLDRPEMISFAGGLPNPDAFPVTELTEVVAHVMADHAPEALQYGPTEGHYRLRKAIAEGMGTHFGAPQGVENTVITSGSQQGLHLLSAVLLDPGDTVLTSSPTYLGALLTFSAMSARVEGVTTDDDGMVPEALEEKLELFRREKRRVKLIYLVPTFQNPTGTTMSFERRRAVYALACRYDLVIVEDDPYGLLRYEGQAVPPFKAFDEEGRVAYLGSFSKILAPGLRIGWLAAEPTLTRKAVIAKQAFDLCANPFGQYCVFEAMRHDLIFKHITVIKNMYRSKRDLMLDAMAQYFPKAVRYNRPEGGLFLWLELPPTINALELLPKAIAHDVAFVTGKAFFPDGSGHNTLRLNFSYARDDQIVEGVRRLADVILGEIELENSGERVDHVEIF